MKKVLHITGYFDERMVYQENLLPLGEKFHGAKPYIVTSDVLPFSKDVLKKGVSYVDGIPVIRIKTLFHIQPKLPFFLIAYKLIKRLKPDVIFVHGIGPILLQVLLYSLFSNFRIVFDCHSEPSKHNKKFIGILYHRFFRYLMLFFNRKIDFFYGVAPECCQFIEEVYKPNKEKIKLLPLPGKYLKRPKVNERKQLAKSLNLPLDKILVLHTGKLPGLKETLSVLKVFQRADIIERFHLIIAGSIDDLFYRENKEIIEVEHVTNLGWLDTNELRKIMIISDILLQPGSLSNSFIDAMCCGLPLALKDTPQGKYLTQFGNGLLFEKGIDQEYTQAIALKLISNIKNLEKFQQNAIESQKILDYRTTAKITVNHYNLI